MQQDKIFFASDFHLGAPNYEESLTRERKIVRWLEAKKPEMEALYLMGDLFDFYFEWKKVVPKGYVRLLGKLAELTDSGIPVHYWVGNHDMWIGNYLEQEVGVQMHYHPEVHRLKDKVFYLAHGDGLGPGDQGYKMLKKVFRSPLSIKAYSLLHPSFSTWLANFFSTKSRQAHAPDNWLGEEQEFLVVHSRNLLKQRHVDYFVYGHRHLPMVRELQPERYYVNLGDWLQHFTYGEFDGKSFELKRYEL